MIVLAKDRQAAIGALALFLGVTWLMCPEVFQADAVPVVVIGMAVIYTVGRGK
jgi:hypothetical protein